jgi:hypothetical protein
MPAAVCDRAGDDANGGSLDMDGQKCRREQCTCYVDLGQVYCCDHCRRNGEAIDEGPHGPCGCHHTGCERS